MLECAGLAIAQADLSGCFGLATDSKPNAVNFYRRYGFIPLADPAQDGTQLQFLSMSHIRVMRSTDASP